MRTTRIVRTGSVLFGAALAVVLIAGCGSKPQAAKPAAAAAPEPELDPDGFRSRTFGFFV